MMMYNGEALVIMWIVSGNFSCASMLVSLPAIHVFRHGRVGVGVYLVLLMCLSVTVIMITHVEPLTPARTNTQ
jgi:hypothetical protein